MKKSAKLLAVGLCLTFGAAAFIACGDDADNKKQPTTPQSVPYYVAGQLTGTASWDAPTDATRFSKTEDANVYTVTLDLWKGDTFKIRYEGKDWGEFQVNYDNGYDATQKADPDAKIIDGEGYDGEHNFGVGEEGNYTLSLDVSGQAPVLSYKYNGEANVKAPILVTKIELNKKTATLKVGDKETLVATLTPAAPDDDTIVWESSKESVATVDENGQVTAVAVGEAKIQATAMGSDEANMQFAECVITVIEAGAEIVEVESVTLDKTTATVHAGATETLTATVLPENATAKTVAWASSDTTVATVADGVVTAVKAGTATITATAGEKEATCTVTVATDLYLAGNGKTPDLTGWNTKDKYADLAAGAAFAESEGVYTLTVDLDNGAEFKILFLGNGWDGALDKNKLAAEDTENGVNLASQVGSNGENIKILADGQYTITVTKTEDNYSVAIKRIGDATVEFPWEYDVLFKGAWSDRPEGVTDWTFHKFGTETFDKEKLTVTADIVMEAIDFGVATAPKGTQEQVAWFNSDVMSCAAGVTGITLTPGENAKCTTAGTYNVTITLNASGAITSIVFNSFTAAA